MVKQIGGATDPIGESFQKHESPRYYDPVLHMWIDSEAEQKDGSIGKVFLFVIVAIVILNLLAR